jgi:hypothetical protein
MKPTLEQYRAAAKKLIAEREKKEDRRMVVPDWGSVATCTGIHPGDGPGAFVDVTIWVKEEEAS